MNASWLQITLSFVLLCGSSQAPADPSSRPERRLANDDGSISESRISEALKRIITEEFHRTAGGGALGFKSAAPRGPEPETSPEPEPAPGPAEVTRPADSMQCIRCPTILVLVALVLCSPGVFSQPDRDQDQYQNQDLDLELRHHRLLQRARSAGLLPQEWSKRAVEDLLAQMSLPESDTQREAEVVSMATGGRMNLERSVDPPNNLPPRERKAGCKNFYWKGFTSC